MVFVVFICSYCINRQPGGAFNGNAGGGQKCPKMAKNGQKWPKMAKKPPKMAKKP